MNESNSSELTSEDTVQQRLLDFKAERNKEVISKTTDIHKYVYAKHEALVSLGTAEANLHTQVVCSKNPAHKAFIPVDEFELHHLPENFRNKYYFDFIKATFDFTVKIDVKLTSSSRPEFWAKTSNPYPFYTLRNSFQLRSGTGSIRSIYKYEYGFSAEGVAHRDMNTLCVCKKCLKSNSPSKVWWEIEIMTATHVVFDESEASNTECIMFYNHQKSEVVRLDAVHLDYADVETDKAWLRGITCNKDLVSRLEKMSEQYNKAFTNIYTQTIQTQRMENIAVIVSHPHGCTKHVTLGKWLKRFTLDDDTNVSAYLYETHTCEGTSGATVYVMGYYNGQTYMYSDHHVHVGMSADGINFCGNGFDDAFEI